MRSDATSEAWRKRRIVLYVRQNMVPTSLECLSETMVKQVC